MKVVSGEAQQAQEYVMALPDRVRKLTERAEGGLLVFGRLAAGAGCEFAFCVRCVAPCAAADARCCDSSPLVALLVKLGELVGASLTLECNVRVAAATEVC